VSLGEGLGFSGLEMRRRRAALGQEMDRNAVSHALAYGANRSGSAVSWLTGVAGHQGGRSGRGAGTKTTMCSWSRSSITFRRPAGFPLFASSGLAGAPSRRRSILLPVAAVPGRIGLVGALPFDQYLLLTEQVPVVADLNPVYARLRPVKSAEELAALRRGAVLTDAAIMALAGR
jgi:hypothetical protein